MEIDLIPLRKNIDQKYQYTILCLLLMSNILMLIAPIFSEPPTDQVIFSLESGRNEITTAGMVIKYYVTNSYISDIYPMKTDFFFGMSNLYLLSLLISLSVLLFRNLTSRKMTINYVAFYVTATPVLMLAVWSIFYLIHTFVPFLTGAVVWGHASSNGVEVILLCLYATAGYGLADFVWRA